MQLSIKKQRYGNFWLVFDMALLALLLTVGMTSNMVTIAVVVLLCYSFLMKTKNEIVTTMLFFYPFYCLFKFNGLGVSYYNIILAAAIPCLMHEKREGGLFNTWRLKLKKNVISLILLTSWCVITSMVNGVNALSSTVLDILVPLLFIVCVIDIKELNVERIIYAFSVGSIIAGIAGSDMVPISNVDAYIDTVAYRVGGVRLIRLQGFTVNPNYYSLDLNMAIAGLLCLGYLKKRKIRIREIVMIVLLAMLGIMTLSKSFFLGLGVTLVVYFYSTGNLKGAISAFGIGAAAAVIIFVLYQQGNSYIIALIDRFSGADSLDNLTSSRSEIWLGYLNVIFSRPLRLLIGFGLNAPYPTEVPKASHSLYIESIYYLGLIGILILGSFLFALLKKQRRRLIQYVPITVFAVRAFAINLLVREAFGICLIIIFMFLNYDVNSMEPEDRQIADRYGGNK